MVAALRASVGDFRDWAAVAAWSEAVAAEIAATMPAPRAFS